MGIMHKEGNATFKWLMIITVISILLGWFMLPQMALYLFIAILAFLWLFFLNFFRNPNRSISATNEEIILCPADGKIVVIEETEETEFLNEKRMQVSIFMSPLNVHVNRNPINGEVIYYKYHEGMYLAAWNPKASTDNERTTTVYKHEKGTILMRQIAGALARRIVCYLAKGDIVTQGDDMGFIKLGSRVDLFLPLDAEINVTLNQVVKGNQDIIAKW